MKSLKAHRWFGLAVAGVLVSGLPAFAQMEATATKPNVARKADEATREPPKDLAPADLEAPIAESRSGVNRLERAADANDQSVPDNPRQQQLRSLSAGSSPADTGDRDTPHEAAQD